MAKVHNNPLIPQLNAIGGNAHLKEDVELMPPQHSRLVLQLGDGDPDDSFSSIPYEKGFQLLFYLEQLVGEEAFLKFFRSYLQKFKYGTVTSQEFLDFFTSVFESISDDQVAWNAWFYEPGMPVVTPSFDDTLSKAASDLANAWLKVDDKFQAKSTFAAHAVMPVIDITKWTTSQMVCFLDELVSICEERGRPLHKETILSLGDKYRIKGSKNSEILLRYCKLAIAAGKSDLSLILLVPVVEYCELTRYCSVLVLSSLASVPK